MVLRDPWRAVGRIMGVGAVFDLAFAVAILGFTRPAAKLLGIGVPSDPVYLGLCGVLLALLSGLYALAAFEPHRYSGIPPISAVGRAFGFALFVWAWRGGRPPAFLVLGLADLAMGALTLSAWLRARRAAPSP